MNPTSVILTTLVAILVTAAPLQAQTNGSDAAPAPKQPSDSLAGPPFVSCKAWAIGDGNTGKLLAGHRAHEPLPMASTTKVMTAYVVLTACREHPDWLDEQVTFSERADSTIGSSCKLKAGESIRVRELLFGLLLPSGNDAAVALAEHFGPRVAPSAAEQIEDPLQQFIAAMNAAARELKLKQTHFVNPNGLTHDDHHASAADLMTLSWHALQVPVLARCVATRQYTAKVRTADGETRRVTWNNTNRLLKIDGYDGVKTGTTDAAGACLIGSGHRGGRHRIIVVLGASGSNARYADIRNLFRFAWNDAKP